MGVSGNAIPVPEVEPEDPEANNSMSVILSHTATKKNSRVS